MELISSGFWGDVYRASPDRVLKIMPQWPKERVEREMEKAALVHSLGIPSPEVYDVVCVDGTYGYEMEYIDGPLLIDVWRECPEKRRTLERSFVDLGRHVNSIEVPAGKLDSVTTRYKQFALNFADYLPAYMADEYCRLLDKLDVCSTLLHGDFYPTNIILAERGPVLVDFFDVATGHPFFDMICMCHIYYLMPIIRKATVAKASRCTPEQCDEFWNRYLEAYFSNVEDEGFKIRCTKACLEACYLLRVRHWSLAAEKRNPGTPEFDECIQGIAEAISEHILPSSELLIEVLAK